MQARVAAFYIYRFLDELGRTRIRLEKLPAENLVSARLLVERRRNATVLSLWALPSFLTPLMNTIMLMWQRAIPLPLLAEFFHNLGIMLKSGLPIDIALTELSQDTAHRGLRQMIINLAQSVRSGNSLASGLDWHAHLVPDTVRSLVAIGEQSGNLDSVLTDAAEHLNRMVSLRQGALKTLIYPCFVVVSILGAALFWVYYVLPDLSDIFRQMGARLPPLTLSVMAWVHSFRDLLDAYGIWLLLGFVLFIILLSRLTVVKRAFYTLAYHLPITRTLVRTSSMAFISEYLAMLVSAGINLLECLEILEGTVRNTLYQERIRQVREGVKRGNSLSKELTRAKVFPPMMVRLVSVGEQSGTLDKQLRILSSEYSRRLSHTVGTLAEILKPAVLLLAGGLFIFVVVVFLLPVYDLIAQSTKLG